MPLQALPNPRQFSVGDGGGEPALRPKTPRGSGAGAAPRRVPVPPLRLSQARTVHCTSFALRQRS